jgi:hypothetical protein
MKPIRTILLVLCVLLTATTASAQTRGWGLGASIFDGDFGVQVRKDFWLGGDISQITGQGSVFFPSKTTFRIDVDYHFILNPEGPGRFYPLAGIDFAFNSDHAKFGLNLGGGANFMLTEKTAAFGEAKFVIGDWDGFVFTLGIYI